LDEPLASPVRSGRVRSDAKREQVQWTCESDERRELERAAGLTILSRNLQAIVSAFLDATL